MAITSSFLLGRLFNILFIRFPCNSQSAMGVGGSTSRPNSSTQRRPQTSSSLQSNPTRHSDSNRPTNSCCSHYRNNHTDITRTVTPTMSKSNTIDDEIEEIVANTLDLVSQHSSSSKTDRRTLERRATEDSVLNNSDVGQRRVLRSGSLRVIKKKSSLDDRDIPIDAKETVPEMDFAKFKRVNHQGQTLQNNGRTMQRQESDLLWRFGLLSPETHTYKMNTASMESDDFPRRLRTRSAPNQGPFIKAPSYDLTEEQLMANIEKEFECTI